MSQTTSLKAETRKRSGSSAINRMRKEGSIPAVIYGSSLDSENLKINRKEITDVLHASASDNILVDLDIEGAAKTQLALIQDVQHDYLKDAILHVDFRAVRDDETIHASVPIHLEGESIGVKNGGVLDHQLHSMMVHCLPKDLPETLILDISTLEVGAAAHVSDLTIPDGVEPALEGGVVVAMVQESRVVEEVVEEVVEGAEAEGEAAEGNDAAAEDGAEKK